jgi:BNR repeat-like domain/Cep192 domain 4
MPRLITSGASLHVPFKSRACEERTVRQPGVFVVIALAPFFFFSCGGGSSSGPVVTNPAVQLSAASLTFFGQVLGTTSPAQAITLTNSGDGSLSISSIALNHGTDFSQSNTCGATLAPAASCQISVTFAPTAGGAAGDSVLITDNAAGSPHIVALSGTGMAGLVKLSTDTFTNTTSQHATEVEPSNYAAGSTIVSVFQVGRFYDGGSSAIGFATSTDGGTTWQNGLLPGITNLQTVAGPYDRVSDPVVVYDLKHTEWLAVTLPIFSAGVVAPNLVVSRSPDGLVWGDPISVTVTGNYDKPWITCDNWPASPHFGNCYIEWDQPGLGNAVQMSTSNDGGLSWQSAVNVPNAAGGIGGQPVVQPNGNVVVPMDDGYEANVLYFTSTDGGATWSSPQTISHITDHFFVFGNYTAEAGGLRYGPLPSAAVDASGEIYVVWPDCSFRSGCSSNDLVMSTSTNGTTWSPPSRIPLDDVASTVDHFIPGLTVDPATSGGTAHLRLVYYYYPVANCTVTTCQLDVGYASSQDGGASWSAPVQLAGPMNLNSLPSTDIGRMAADYISAASVNASAFGVFAVANPNAGATFDEAIYTTATGLGARQAARRPWPAGEIRLRHARSNHVERRALAKVR